MDVYDKLSHPLALVVLPAYGLARGGGVAPLGAQLVGFDPTFVDPLGLGAFIGFVGIGLGSPGQPHIRRDRGGDDHGGSRHDRLEAVAA